MDESSAESTRAAVEPLERFGQRIKSLRIDRGLSQEAFSDTLGIDRSHLGGIERGERNPSLKLIFRIAIAIDLPVGDLFE